MANKYCDHLSYDASTFTITASFPAYSGLMTVTGTPPFPVRPGMYMTGGPNFPALNATATRPAMVNSYGTGTGGAGTYNCSIPYQGAVPSQTFTCMNTRPADNIPDSLWAVPQDGDGMAKGPSTASAVVSIDFTALTAVAGNTIAVGGATLTCVASGAGNNQFNAGAGAALVASLVAAINRVSNTVTVASGSPAAGWYQGRIQDLLWARINPTVATQLDIMTRCGSATYNNNQNWRVLTSGMTDGAANTQVNATFSGGVSGCWNYLWMNGTDQVTNVWPSGAVQPQTYGVWCDHIHAGTRDAGDWIYIRSNKRVWIGGGGMYHTWVMPAIGTKDNYVNMVIDDGTTWPGDGPYPTIQARFDNNPYSWTFAPGTSAFVNVFGKRYPNGTHSFNFIYSAVGSNSWPCSFSVNSPATIVGFCMDNTEATNTPSLYFSSSGSPAYSYTKSVYRDCKIRTKTNSAIMDLQNDNLRLETSNLIVEQVGVATAHPGLLYVRAQLASLLMESPTFIGFVPGSQLYVQNNNSRVSTMIRNPSFGNVTLHGPVNATQAANDFGADQKINTITSSYGAREFMVDSRFGFVEWNPARSYPTLNARLLDGVTPWSILATPTTVTGNINATSPLTLPRFGKITPSADLLAEGVRTVSVELAIEQSLVWDAGCVSMQVQYQATDGSLNVIDTFDPNYGPLTPSSAIWSSESNGQVLFTNGGPILHNKFKLSVTTPKPVKASTEIGVVVRLHRSVANITKTTFICPEMVIA